VRVHTIGSRPHVQGAPAPLRLRHSAGELTDGAGLLLLRRLWDQIGLGERLDTQASWLGGAYRPSLMVELWVVLSLYGGGHMDDLRMLAGRGIRRLFSWKAVPDATTFGRWLRRGGERLARQLDQLLWQMVRTRWAVSGVPKAVMLVLDSTVVQRYGLKQAGAENGYNPMKRGRPSHHPLVAFLAETGDCLGVIWRPGNANTAAGAIPWIQTLVGQLRAAGVQQITVRLDKGFFSREMVEALEALGVSYVLKVPDFTWVESRLSAYRRSRKDPSLWTASGTLYGARLLTTQQRREIEGQDELVLGSYEILKTAHVLTNVEGLTALSAWRLYNQGARVEHRIEELGQLSVGQTAVDDLGGNHLLWALGALAYQMLHTIRTTALSGAWRRAQPKRLRAWLFRLPAKLTTHARKQYVQLQRTEPLRRELLQAAAAGGHRTAAAGLKEAGERPAGREAPERIRPVVEILRTSPRNRSSERLAPDLWRCFGPLVRPVCCPSEARRRRNQPDRISGAGSGFKGTGVPCRGRDGLR
jgi:hypothetical protein